MSCRPAISSMSLGRAWVHDLHLKLVEASKAGFKGIEIFYEDLEYRARHHGEPNADNLLRAAAEVRDWCHELNLNIINLQPFMFYEGLVDRKEHAVRIEKLKLWFRIVQVLETDLIQIPSNFASDNVTGDLDIIVQDLIEVAELGRQQTPVVRFAYENLAWGTFTNTWEQIWEVVQRVNRPNFGMCLDSFHICGGVWADPATPSGTTPHADQDLQASIDRLVRTVDVSKIFFIQLVDAERMTPPLIKGHQFFEEGQPARMSWSRNARLFVYEGGYLPVEKVMDALFHGLHYRGWVSLELFSRTMADTDSSVPRSHAERGIASWKRMATDFKLG